MCERTGGVWDLGFRVCRGGKAIGPLTVTMHYSSSLEALGLNVDLLHVQSWTANTASPTPL